MVVTIFVVKSLTLSPFLHSKQTLGGLHFEISTLQVPVQTGYQLMEKKVNSGYKPSILCLLKTLVFVVICG